MKKTIPTAMPNAETNRADGKAATSSEALNEATLQQVASYFQALAEPTRLQILNLLRHRASKVGDLAALAGCSIANVSRHLSLLQQRGLVTRESRGNCAIYRIADPAVFELCELVCGRMIDQAECLARTRATFSVKEVNSTKP